MARVDFSVKPELSVLSLVKPGIVQTALSALSESKELEKNYYCPLCQLHDVIGHSS